MITHPEPMGPPDPSSSVTTLPADGNERAGPHVLPPCKVCGAQATGFHYGVNTCEACKGFFHRSLSRKQEYTCLKSARCTIKPGKRNVCPACRYKRCLQAGMSKEGIKTGRYTYAKRNKDLLEIKRLKTDKKPPMNPETSILPGSDYSGSPEEVSSVESEDPESKYHGDISLAAFNTMTPNGHNLFMRSNNVAQHGMGNYFAPQGNIVPCTTHGYMANTVPNVPMTTQYHTGCFRYNSVYSTASNSYGTAKSTNSSPHIKSGENISNQQDVSPRSSKCAKLDTEMSVTTEYPISNIPKPCMDKTNSQGNKDYMSPQSTANTRSSGLWDPDNSIRSDPVGELTGAFQSSFEQFHLNCLIPNINDDPLQTPKFNPFQLQSPTFQNDSSNKHFWNPLSPSDLGLLKHSEPIQAELFHENSPTEEIPLDSRTTNTGSTDSCLGGMPIASTPYHNNNNTLETDLKPCQMSSVSPDIPIPAHFSVQSKSVSSSTEQSIHDTQRIPVSTNVDINDLPQPIHIAPTVSHEQVTVPTNTADENIFPDVSPKANVLPASSFCDNTTAVDAQRSQTISQCSPMSSPNHPLMSSFNSIADKEQYLQDIIDDMLKAKHSWLEEVEVLEQTHDAIIGIYKGNSPDKLLCIEYAPPSANENKSELWKRWIDLMEKTGGLRRLIKFVKAIPGFRNLDMTDQIQLIKHAFAEVWIINRYSSFDEQTKQFSNVVGAAFDLEKALGEELSEMILKSAVRFQRLEISEEEQTLLIAYVIFASDRCRLFEPRKVESIQQTILEALLFIIRRSHDDVGSRLSAFCSILIELRSMTEAFHKHNERMLSDIGEISPLFWEIINLS